MSTKRPDRVWVVVHVQSGVPVSAEIFRDAVRAERREQRLRKGMREDYDAIALFEAKAK